MKGIDYRWIEALDTVIATGNFERAAEALFITQSAVSQRIKQLEKQVSQPVIVRESPPRPTAVGKKLLGLYRRVKMLEQETLPELQPREIGNVLSVSIASNADSLATWLLPALAPMIKRDEIDINVLVKDESRTLDHIRSGDAIAAISTESSPLHGCNSHYLGKLEYICVATPEFYRTHFEAGINTESIVAAPAVIFDAHDDMHARFLAEHYNLPAVGWRRHVVRSSEGFVTMAEQGMAYCLIPRQMIEKQLSTGVLVDVMPGKQVIRELYWHHWMMESGTLSEMTSACVSYANRVLPQ